MVNKEVTKVFHSGDLGDVILALPSLMDKAPVDLYLETRPWTKVMTKGRFETIKPLLLDQPYINDVINATPEGDYIDYSTFRNGGCPYGWNIANVQSMWVNKAPTPYKPWITATPDPKSKGRVIVHRSARYRNPTFSWYNVGQALENRMLSVGFEDEHHALEEACQRKIERVAVRDFKHLAELIVGADFFIGNQSSPLSIATGLGVKIIQETCLWIPDCIYRGAHIQYVYNGVMELGGRTWVSPDAVKLSPKVTPPKGWHFEKDGKMYSDLIITNLVGRLKVSEAEILAYNTERVMREYPSFLGLGRSSPSRLKLLLDQNGLNSSKDGFE